MDSFKKYLDKKLKTPEQIAKEHDVPLSQVKQALEAGKKVEGEHTTQDDVAYTIAQAHVGEDPEYYKKLKHIENTTNKSSTK